jgi:hypothetical protein
MNPLPDELGEDADEQSSSSRDRRARRPLEAPPGTDSNRTVRGRCPMHG